MVVTMRSTAGTFATGELYIEGDWKRVLRRTESINNRGAVVVVLVALAIVNDPT
jgi:hypothetical protein